MVLAFLMTYIYLTWSLYLNTEVEEIVNNEIILNLAGPRQIEISTSIGNRTGLIAKLEDQNGFPRAGVNVTIQLQSIQTDTETTSAKPICDT